MYLEKIEIFGFKSFADKTVIHFSKPVTAIVGPNGCGKSNVVDAFRWVLGGPSAKSLRSDKMVDVIFSGTEKRKPLNYAQISLTFTNISKKLSIDFEEICITRRLYRSGESEYLINRNPVRLKDIHKLLWEAGLGKNAFYIFEQGKIDELITSSPHERRNIFEEAAKIMHFKEKRKEAFRKLTQVEANLKRVFDIQGEVNKQIETLKKQAEEAEIYKEKKSLFEKLEKDLVIAKWQFNNNKQRELEKQIETKHKEEEEVKNQIKQLNQETQALKEKHHSKSVEAKTSYEKFFEAKKSKELASFEFKSHQKKLDELFEQKTALRNKLQAFHHKHLEEHKAYLENQDVLNSHQKELSSLLSDLEKSVSSIQDLEEKVNQESLFRKESQEKLLKVVNEENKLGMDFKNTLTLLESTQERCESLSQEASHGEKKLKEKKESLENLLSKKGESTLKLQEFEKLLESLIQEVDNKETHLSQIKEKLSNLSEKMTSKNAKINLLQKLKDEFDGYGKGAKTLLEFSQNDSHSLYDKISPLTDWIIPEKGYEVCLSSLLGPYFQTVVVKNKEHLKEVLKVAEEENLSGFSVLCLEDLDKEELNSKQSFAKSNLVSNHFLNHIQEAETLPDTPIKFSLIGKKYFLDEKKVLHNLSNEKNNLFIRETELRNHYQELLTLEKEYQKQKEQFNLEEPNLKALTEKKSQTQSEINDLKMEINSFEFKTKSISEELQEIENSFNQHKARKGELLGALERLDTKQKELSKKYENEKTKRLELESHFKKIENEFEKNFGTLKEKRSLKQSLDDRIKKIEKDAQNLKENIKIFESKSADFEDQIQKMNSEIELNEKEYQKLEKESLNFVENEKKLTENLVVADKHYHSFEDELEAIEKEQKEQDINLNSLRTHLEEMQQKDLEINNKKAEAQAENKLYLDQINEKYEIEVDQLTHYEIEANFSISQSEKELRRLRRSLEGYTEINLKAVADCKEKQERFKFLEDQIEDLVTSRDKLTQIISELDKTSREMFLETFESIRAHFKNNYALLFQGGEADLKLNASEDVLEAGIDIIAQPPGKKMRSIQQLSGGEKCLTAVALLFALFETQSIPFCILDEIDAPLDDTNIERFTNVLKQFVKNHQFIIITHNKRTMAMADTLLGISMQEKGVTKVIPFQFNKESKKEPEKALA